MMLSKPPETQLLSQEETEDAIKEAIEKKTGRAVKYVELCGGHLGSYGCRVVYDYRTKMPVIKETV